MNRELRKYKWNQHEDMTIAVVSQFKQLQSQEPEKKNGFRGFNVLM